MTTAKTIALSRQMFLSKVTSILFNTLSRFVIAFLPSSKGQKLFRYSSLSAIKEVSFAYLRLLIFLPANLIPACDLSSLHFTWCTLYTKSRDRILLTEIHIVKAMVFAVVMCGCETWTIKKAEHWITDVFKMWCWRRVLRVPWTVRRSNVSILKEINCKYLLEGLMLKLKL